ncbi:hypothetical protein Pd630_LPD00144 [Rhodococcus opacus PD630]|nr:hypothetical protein Pd630_LPD00144 [Rhodococcus opacus PD630]
MAEFSVHRRCHRRTDSGNRSSARSSEQCPVSSPPVAAGG